MLQWHCSVVYHHLDVPSLVLAAHSGVKSCCRNFCRIKNTSLAYRVRNFILLSLRLGRLRAAIENYVLEFLYRVCYILYMLLFTGASLVTENTGYRWYLVRRHCCCFAESRGRCFARIWPIRTREYSFDAGILLATLGHAWRCQEMLGEAIIGELLLRLWA